MAMTNSRADHGGSAHAADRTEPCRARERAYSLANLLMGGNACFGTTGVRGIDKAAGSMQGAGAQAAERLPPRDPEEVSDPEPGFVSSSLDALARDAGWLMPRPAEEPQHR